MPGQVRTGLIVVLTAALVHVLMFASARAELRRVSVELVLAIDVSLSVNDAEYQLQVGGIANALRRPEVLSVIGSHEHGVAVALLQWSGTATYDEVPRWWLLSDPHSVLAYADEIEATPRSPYGYLTGIGNAILGAAELLNTNAYMGDDRKIDISGDGRNNAGPEPSRARDLALAQGISINGLAILDTEPQLGPYYQSEVVGGPGAFVIIATDFSDFADAMARKLVRELEPKMSDLPSGWPAKRRAARLDRPH